MKGYYHVSSHGLERNDIFRSRENFIAGMNDIAISVLGFDISMLCFCLMSNHFHFVLYGSESECRRFANEYKRRCAMRMRLHSGEFKGLKDVEIHISHVDSLEYLENVIAYVLRNPLAAGILMMPYHYPWSSVSLYFNERNRVNGTRLNDMSVRKRFRVLKSRMDVPDKYVVDEHGMILPSCYVDAELVEKIYRHPARLMMSLSRKIENEIEIKLGIAGNVSITDQEIMTQLSELLRAEFHKDSLAQLSMEERIRLCLMLKRNFKAGVKQIARITRIDPEVVAKVI